MIKWNDEYEALDPLRGLHKCQPNAFFRAQPLFKDPLLHSETEVVLTLLPPNYRDPTPPLLLPLSIAQPQASWVGKKQTPPSWPSPPPHCLYYQPNFESSRT